MVNLTPAKRRKIRSLISKHNDLPPGLIKDIRSSFLVFGFFELMALEDKDTCNELYQRTSWASLKVCFFGTINSIAVTLLLKNSSPRVKKTASLAIFFSTAALYLYTPIQNNILFSQRLVSEGFFDKIILEQNEIDKMDGIDSEIETENDPLPSP